MEHVKTFWLAFWSGLAAPGLLFSGQTPHISRIAAPTVTSRDAMRADWLKIGKDFAHVIAREQEHRT
jgi:hypothetical protein